MCTLFRVAAVVVIFFGATSLQATEVLDTEFSAGEGYKDGPLQFQNGWLGQNVDGQPKVVTTGDGAVVCDKPYLRSLYSEGVRGSKAGSDTDGVGPGFDVGDVFKIQMTVAYDLSGEPNAILNATGVRGNFSTGNYDAGPTIGLSVGYSQYDPAKGGSLRVFTNLSRKPSAGEDVPFGIMIDGHDIGLDPAGTRNRGAKDLSSDVLVIGMTMRKTSDTEWTATELAVKNKTTGKVLAKASTDRPKALETMEFAGDDAYFASRWTGSDSATKVSRVRFEFVPARKPDSK